MTTLRNVSGHPYHLGAACVRVEADGTIEVSEATCPSVIRELQLLHDAGHFEVVREEAPEEAEILIDETDETPKET